MMPLVSIIMPNFNKAPFIEASIKSCLSQTYKDFELIIVDDHSTDGSIELICKMAKSDKRIFFYKRDNQVSGGNICRNEGLYKSKGKFVIFLDSDDLMLSTCLQERIDKMSNTLFDFCLFKVGTFNKKIGDRVNVWIVNPTSNHLIDFLKHNLPWNISSPMWRRDFLIKLKGFNESLVRLQDVELHSRALLSCNNYFVFNDVEPQIFYRVDMERQTISQYQFLLNFVRGCIDYVNIISKQLDEIDRPDLKKYLSGTLATAFSRILFEFRKGLITNQEKYYLIRLLYDNVLFKKSIAKSFFLNFLIILNNPKYPYVKGLDRIIKFTFINL